MYYNMTDPVCSGCDQAIIPGDALCLLACGHVYHRRCVVDWLNMVHGADPVNLFSVRRSPAVLAGKYSDVILECRACRKPYTWLDISLGGSDDRLGSRDSCESLHQSVGRAAANLRPVVAYVEYAGGYVHPLTDPDGVYLYLPDPVGAGAKKLSVRMVSSVSDVIRSGASAPDWRPPMRIRIYRCLCANPSCFGFVLVPEVVAVQTSHGFRGAPLASIREIYELFSA